MDERLRFVARLLDGEKMARLCVGLSTAEGHRRTQRIPAHALQPVTRPRTHGYRRMEIGATNPRMPRTQEVIRSAPGDIAA